LAIQDDGFRVPPIWAGAADRGLVVHGVIMLLLGLLSGFSPFFAKAKIAGLDVIVCPETGVFVPVLKLTS
jgi:hypothetical protein